MIKQITGITIWLIIVIVALEFGLLRGIDPWGANTYYNDIDTLKRAYVPDSTRYYRLPEGTYTFGHWALTITESGRLTPNTSPDKPIIAFVGDSVTMGHAVNDADTFVNALAQTFPNCTLRNYGVDGYNIIQVQATIDHYPAAHYVYLLISNDADPVLTIAQMHTGEDDLWQGLHRYWYHWQRSRPRGNVALAEDVRQLPDWFLQSFDTLQNRPDVTIVGFQGEALAEQMQVNRIPYYRTRVSYADPHPDAQGHQDIATGLTPIVAQWCGGQS